MKHLGDITKIDGWKIPYVDVITGGSPCQDLSQAGKRAGLEGERSGLFMEQIRIVREMRNHAEADRRAGVPVPGCPGRFLVWENVYGALTSNNGKDFATVLGEIVRLKVEETPDPPVPQGGWPTAGVIVGDGYSISPTDSTTLSFGELPKDGAASLWSPISMAYLPQRSLLSAILEPDADPKYYLSAKACLGILTRAHRRGKELPEELKEALLTKVEMTEEEFMTYYARTSQTSAKS